MYVYLPIHRNGGTSIFLKEEMKWNIDTMTDNDLKENLQVEIESVDVTSDFEPDNELSSLLEQFTGTI